MDAHLHPAGRRAPGNRQHRRGNRGGRLEIVNIDGAIEAFPATGDAVEVRARIEVRSSSDERAQEILKGLSLQEDVTPGAVRVETPQIQELRGFRQSVRVEYRVALPPGLDVTLRTQNGGVRLENVEGRLAASSTNGGVQGRGVSGSIEATGVNGGISMDLARITGDVRLVTVNGGIVVSVNPDISATIDASTVNGGVVVSDALTLTNAERARQRVTGRINGGGPTIYAQTTNGGVRVGSGLEGGDQRRAPLPPSP